MLFDLLARKLPFPSPQGGSETLESAIQLLK
ncbi:MAG: hypothetical protein RJAPGHWK_001860, partial [Candidatus Fervidibacter sp.]